MKQTALEWLFDHLVPHLDWSKVEDRELFRKLKAEAKAMEKEQIHDAWLSAWKDSMINPLEDKYYEIEAEEYYNKTYGGKNEQQ
jgi:hypothetical protein